jgi:hypothetical protein
MEGIGGTHLGTLVMSGWIIYGNHFWSHMPTAGFSKNMSKIEKSFLLQLYLLDMILKGFAQFYFSDSTISANFIGWNEISVLTQFQTFQYKLGVPLVKRGKNVPKIKIMTLFCGFLFNIVLIYYIWPWFNLYNLGFGAQLNFMNNIKLSIWSPFFNNCIFQITFVFCFGWEQKVQQLQTIL